MKEPQFSLDKPDPLPDARFPDISNSGLFAAVLATGDKLQELQTLHEIAEYLGLPITGNSHHELAVQYCALALKLAKQQYTEQERPKKADTRTWRPCTMFALAGEIYRLIDEKPNHSLAGLTQILAKRDHWQGYVRNYWNEESGKSPDELRANNLRKKFDAMPRDIKKMAEIDYLYCKERNMLDQWQDGINEILEVAI